MNCVNLIFRKLLGIFSVRDCTFGFIRDVLYGLVSLRAAHICPLVRDNWLRVLGFCGYCRERLAYKIEAQITDELD